MKLDLTEKGIDLMLQCLQVQNYGTDEDFYTRYTYTFDGTETGALCVNITEALSTDATSHFVTVPENVASGETLVYDEGTGKFYYEGTEYEELNTAPESYTDITESLVETQYGKIGIRFTKILYGNGSDATQSATDLSNRQYEVEITKLTRESGSPYVTLEAEFNNSTVASGFRATETGILVADPDNPNNRNKDILFAYGHCEEKDAIYIPANNDFVLETTEEFVVYIGTTENVSAELSKSLTYASRAEFDEHVQNFSNPHAVNAEQVGLGNVPNVTTNNQTPTYNVATTLATLISGEALSIAFGKIKLAITKLIDHLGNKSNPHGVTASQVNAADKDHKHSASDINSGTLGVARGGTGKSSFSQGQVLYASSTTMISGVPNNKGAMYKSNSQGSPLFGTLPVDCGGTGKTSLGGDAPSCYRGIGLGTSAPDSIPTGELYGVYST